MLALATLIFGVVYILLTLVVRALMQRHRTGDTGIRYLSLPPGSTQWWSHWTFVIGIGLTAIAAPIAGLAGLAPIRMLEHPISQGLGVTLAVLGIFGVFIAQLMMGPSWRIAVDEAERTELVTTGAFGVVRNPIFTAMATTFLGLPLMLPNVLAVVGLAAAVIAMQIQVRLVEEPYLHRVHAASYDDYASRVGRFLPGIGRLRPRLPDS